MLGAIVILLSGTQMEGVHCVGCYVQHCYVQFPITRLMTSSATASLSTTVSVVVVRMYIVDRKVQPVWTDAL